MAVEAKDRNRGQDEESGDTAKDERERDGDHVGACPSVLQWGPEAGEMETNRTQSCGESSAVSLGEDTFHWSVFTTYWRPLGLEMSLWSPWAGVGWAGDSNSQDFKYGMSPPRDKACQCST